MRIIFLATLLGSSYCMAAALPAHQRAEKRGMAWLKGLSYPDRLAYTRNYLYQLAKQDSAQVRARLHKFHEDMTTELRYQVDRSSLAGLLFVASDEKLSKKWLLQYKQTCEYANGKVGIVAFPNFRSPVQLIITPPSSPNTPPSTGSSTDSKSSK